MCLCVVGEHYQVSGIKGVSLFTEYSACQFPNTKFCTDNGLSNREVEIGNREVVGMAVLGNSNWGPQHFMAACVYIFIELQNLLLL